MIDQNIYNKEVNFHGAKGLIFIGDKILVYRRDNKTNYFPFHIDLPGGGREHNESPFETFQREVTEEFGIDINATDILYAKKHIDILDSSRESYFIVVNPKNIEEKDIIFGDEGLEFFLMSPAEYLKRDDAIKSQEEKVLEYLAFQNNLI